MKTTERIFVVMIGMLLAVGAGAAVTAVSVEASLDTRSYTMDWSAERTLNTKEHQGTLFLIR